MAGSSEISLVDPASMAAIVAAVLDDLLYNVISDTVLKAHREEKTARMRSAAIQAQQAKDRAKAEASPGGEPQTITTSGATIDHEDRIFLHGNPLSTTPEILCPTCRLPRLNHPTTGRNSRPPDPSKEYCAKQPYIEKDGCDIYGKSLALEKPSKKKANPAPTSSNSKNKQGNKDNESRSGSESPGGNSPSANNNNNNNNTKNSNEAKPQATSVPSGKCPNCPRYMAFTRIAQHMDRCMGYSGRASSKNAMSKIAAASSTPKETSRASTPKPPSGSQGSASGSAAAAGSSSGPASAAGTASAPGSGSGAAGSNTKKRKLDKGSDDEAEEKTPIKKKKMSMGKKDGKGKAVNADIARVKGAEKRLPGQGEGKESTPPIKAERKDSVASED